MFPSFESFFLCDSVDGFHVVTKLTVVGQLDCNFIERLHRRFRGGRFVVKLGCPKEQRRYGLLVILERPLCSQHFQLYRPSLLHRPPPDSNSILPLCVDAELPTGGRGLPNLVRRGGPFRAARFECLRSGVATEFLPAASSACYHPAI